MRCPLPRSTTLTRSFPLLFRLSHDPLIPFSLAPLQKASDESSKIKPWTLVAKSKLKAEEELKNIAGYGCPFFFFFHSFILFSHIAHLTCCSLNYVIVRPAIVYGTGDVLGISE